MLTWAIIRGEREQGRRAAEGPGAGTTEHALLARQPTQQSSQHRPTGRLDTTSKRYSQDALASHSARYNSGLMRRKELANVRASTSHGLATLAPLTDLTLAFDPTQTTRHHHNHAHQISTRLRCCRGKIATHLWGGRSVGRYRTRSRASRARPDAHRRTTASTPAGYTHKVRIDGGAERG